MSRLSHSSPVSTVPLADFCHYEYIIFVRCSDWSWRCPITCRQFEWQLYTLPQQYDFMQILEQSFVPLIFLLNVTHLLRTLQSSFFHFNWSILFASTCSYKGKITQSNLITYIWPAGDFSLLKGTPSFLTSPHSCSGGRIAVKLMTNSSCFVSFDRPYLINQHYSINWIWCLVL